MDDSESTDSGACRRGCDFRPSQRVKDRIFFGERDWMVGLLESSNFVTISLLERPLRFSCSERPLRFSCSEHPLRFSFWERPLRFSC